MKYVCLIYGEEANFDALSKSESDSLISDSLAYDEVLRKSGHYITSDALQSVRNAATVRRRKDKVSVTDGPFAETKEQLLGFILIEAKDRDDAIRVASRIPCGRMCSVEVRPVENLGNEQEAAI